MLAAAAILSFMVAFAVVRLLLSRLGRFALDQPNDRSLHDRPVPRTGGLAVMLGASVSVAFSAAHYAWLPMLLAAGLAAVSLVDDVRGMPSALRLAVHLAGATVLCWYVLSPMHTVTLAVLVLSVAWVTNLYNFMDGSDGLAGGMAVVGFGAYAFAAHASGHDSLAALSLAIAGASAAFLVHNFYPARIFMGDVGSIPLGFLAAALGLLGWRNDLWPLWFPLLVFAPFIGDATVTLLKRAARGERVWQAHREHYYQRLVRMGFGHRGAALAGYAVMVVCAALALLARNQSPATQWLVVLTAMAGLAILAVWVDVRWARFARGTSSA